RRHQPARGSARAARALVSVRGPRSRGRAAHRGPDRGDVPRQDRRDRRCDARLRAGLASVHAGPAVGDPAAGPAQGAGPPPHPARRGSAEPGGPPVGVPVPNPLSEVRRPRRGAAPAVSRGGATAVRPERRRSRRRVSLRGGGEGRLTGREKVHYINAVRRRVVKVRSRRIALWAMLAAVLALVVAACGGSDSGNGGSSTAAPTKSQQASATKQEDINAQPLDKLKKGGTVRWAVDQFSTQWNYNQLN